MSLSSRSTAHGARRTAHGVLSPAFCTMRTAACGLLLAACALRLAPCATAQEALRMSLASEEAADARQRASEEGYYNLNYGPIKARIQAGLGMEYVDNLNYNNKSPEGDAAIRPGVNIESVWPVTELNSLHFSTGLGYLKYLSKSELDSFYITPDSNLSFLMYAGNFAINIHDRFSLTEGGAQTPSISSANQLGLLQNTFGAGVDWDMNKIILSATADYDLLRSTTETYNYIGRDSELFSGRAAYVVNNTTKVGLDTAGGLTTRVINRLRDNVYYSAGPFAESRITDNIKATLSAGYVAYSFSDVLSDGRDNLDGFYAKATASHRVNQWLNYSLLLSKQLQSDYYRDLDDLYTVGGWANWTFIRNLTISTGFYYQTGKLYSAVDTTEKSTYYSPNLALLYQFNPKLSAYLRYQIALRDSSLPDRNYTQNRVGFGVNYTF